MNKRSQVTGAIFLLLFFALVFRFYELQIADAAFYEQRAEAMYNTEKVLPAKRGTIYDRNGETLATETTAYTVVAILSPSVKTRVEDVAGTASALAPYLNMSETDIQNLLSLEGRYQVELRPGGWKVDRETMKQIEALELQGITFREESKRTYPNQNFASHVLGFLNNDEEPVMGLESFMDESLKGEHGKISFKRDAESNRLPNGLESIVQPQNGDHIYLTLDERIQLYVEQALDKAQEEYNPEKMTVVVSRPDTGEILAMASRPSFNPNQYRDITNYMNHAITSTFEPGSTFKIITLAAAIEEGLYNGNETYLSGVYKLPGGEVPDHQRQGWGYISFLEGVQKSSNVAFTILGYERMQKEVFYKYIYDFGFGELTGIDLPNEKRGFVKSPHNIPPLDLANMTFGQGVTVTAIQQIAAINAIANGGTLLKPYIIDRVVDAEEGNLIQQNQREVVEEQIISKETAKEVAQILETVITDGTGKNFYLDGYAVAGKTGTAQKVGDDGRYVRNKHIHNFIGFAPMDNPELSVYVLVDAPEVEHYSYGGFVVSEIFKHIMQNSLQYLSIKPQIEEVSIQANEGKKASKVEAYTGVSLMAAKQRAEEDGYKVIVIGNGTSVQQQLPAAGAASYPNETLYLITNDSGESTVPDMSGWTLRNVKDWASIVGVELSVLGRGYVVTQSQQADSIIRSGDTMSIVLEPKFSSDSDEFFEDELENTEGEGQEGSENDDTEQMTNDEEQNLIVE
ncbi:penicillin-binding protein 2B [Bacillus horti]|uniref:serine-type D-Ala-D-Ala carboxypeptidase n=2 Tax=Caldalkalibacillus horti TaxID=77523 RepID=A0ABT9VUD8_9BACI|nr:penicillin-binding protein 2B [Bacillus horti]